MRVLLLHGPGEVGSRKKLIEIKEKFDPGNILTYESGTSEKEILDNLSQISLFSESRLIVLEGPPESLNLESVKTLDDVTLAIWSPKEIGQKSPLLKSLARFSTQILFFPEGKEVSVFPFLDKLADGGKEAFLEAKKLEDSGFEFHYLITMVFYLLRILLAVPKNAPAFVHKKVSRQKQRFSTSRIAEIYKYLLELNFKVNSGAVEPSQAQFLMINQFLQSHPA